MNTNRTKIALVFGGKSSEYAVSLQSARSIYEHLNKSKYNIYLIKVTQNGDWRLENPQTAFQQNRNAPLISIRNNDREARVISQKTGRDLGVIDVFFPIIHGSGGEDGNLQGFFETLGIPYVGTGVLGSAIAMDKDVSKRLLNQAEIATTKFITFRKQSIQTKIKKEILQRFTLPVFIKPANTGSSIGISKVKTIEQIKSAIKEAFNYDDKIIIEEAVQGREFECSVLGNSEMIASLPGEIIPHDEFYTYEAKYLNRNGATLKVPADITDVLTKKIQEISIKACNTLECYGMARVDFFYTKDGQLLVNEINTLPGFTKISMFPKLWEASGLPYSKLLDRLIELALETKQTKLN